MSVDFLQKSQAISRSIIFDAVSSYPARTMKNIEESDGTVIFSGILILISFIFFFEFCDEGLRVDFILKTTVGGANKKPPRVADALRTPFMINVNNVHIWILDHHLHPGSVSLSGPFLSGEREILGQRMWYRFSKTLDTAQQIVRTCIVGTDRKFVRQLAQALCLAQVFFQWGWHVRFLFLLFNY